MTLLCLQASPRVVHEEGWLLVITNDGEISVIPPQFIGMESEVPP